MEPRNRGQASEHIQELIVMKKFQRDGRDKMGSRSRLEAIVHAYEPA